MHQSLTIVLLVVLLASAAVTCSGLQSTATSTTLTRIVFAHRHGARMPIEDLDGVCGSFGCGSLTEEGAKMLASLGRTFRQRYNAVLPAHYDYRTTKVLSDNTARCSQSADAFLKALYPPFNSSSLSAMHSLDLTVIDTTHPEILIPWQKTPTFELRWEHVKTIALPQVTAQIEATIISKQEVEAVSKELHLNTTKYCPGRPGLCLAFVADFSLDVQALGTLSNYPLTQKYLPKLQKAILPIFRAAWLSGFNVTTHDQLFYDSAGYAGGQLFLQMLEAAAAKAKHGGLSVNLTEFSGHDVSVIPLLEAMGVVSFDYPIFATAVVFEVSEDDATHALFIRPKLATCEQTPGDHPYTFADIDVVCINASNATYHSTTGCSFDDMLRFAKTRVTKSPAGTCYAYPADLKFNNCTPSVPGAPLSGSACAKYRSSCPLYACGSGYYMAPDLSCNMI